MKKIHIDPEIAGLIPPSSEAERSELEKSILTEGCRDALVLWEEESILLDGHNRHAICSKHGLPFQTVELHFDNKNEAMAWVIRNQFGRRNLTPFQRIELAARLETFFRAKAKDRQLAGVHLNSDGGSDTLCQNSDKGIDTKKELAQMAGVSHDTMSRGLQLAKTAPDDVKEKLRAGQTSINQAYTQLRHQNKRQKTQEKKQAQEKAVILESNIRIHHCGVADLRGHVEPASIEHIVTDPPYSREDLPLYTDLAEFSIYALKPGGCLVVMVGQSYLPEIIERLSERLTYHWIGCYLTPGGQAAQLWQRKVNTFWKPLLVFTKGDYKGEWFGDVCRSDVNANEKNYHHWGQSESGMADILSRWTLPGQLVCDPFLGGGTTAVVAARLKRRFVGCDIDADSVKVSRQRVEETFHLKEELES